MCNFREIESAARRLSAEEQRRLLLSLAASLRDFQGLARDDVRAALEFAAARERRLAGSPAV